MIKNTTILLSIVNSIFKNSDIGGKTVTQLKDCLIFGYELPNADNLTKAICDCVNDADDMDELETNFNYAIQQLQIAKDNCLYAQLDNTPIKQY